MPRIVLLGVVLTAVCVLNSNAAPAGLPIWSACIAVMA